MPHETEVPCREVADACLELIKHIDGDLSPHYDVINDPQPAIVGTWFAFFIKQMRRIPESSSPVPSYLIKARRGVIAKVGPYSSTTATGIAIEVANRMFDEMTMRWSGLFRLFQPIDSETNFSHDPWDYSKVCHIDQWGPDGFSATGALRDKLVAIATSNELKEEVARCFCYAPQIAKTWKSILDGLDIQLLKVEIESEFANADFSEKLPEVLPADPRKAKVLEFANELKLKQRELLVMLSEAKEMRVPLGDVFLACDWTDLESAQGSWKEFSNRLRKNLKSRKAPFTVVQHDNCAIIQWQG